MQETILQICTMKDPLCAQGIEKKLSALPGVHHAQSNAVNGATTVHYDETQVTMADLNKVVNDCGLTCQGESLPLHHGGHVVHSGTAVAHEKHAAHEGREEMGGAMDHSAHGGRAGMTMTDMARDMRNRFLISLLLTIPVFLYSPLFTRFFNINLPLPFGLSAAVIGFVLTTPIVLYGARPFFIGARNGLKAGVLNMSVLVTLSVLAGYIFSVAATFLFDGEVFYEAAAMLVTFVLFGHWMEMRARSGTNQAIEKLLTLAPPLARIERDGQEMEILVSVQPPRSTLCVECACQTLRVEWTQSVRAGIPT